MMAYNELDGSGMMQKERKREKKKSKEFHSVAAFNLLIWNERNQNRNKKKKILQTVNWHYERQETI